MSGAPRDWRELCAWLRELTHSGLSLRFRKGDIAVSSYCWRQRWRSDRGGYVDVFRASHWKTKLNRKGKSRWVQVPHVLTDFKTWKKYLKLVDPKTDTEVETVAGPAWLSERVEVRP